MPATLTLDDREHLIAHIEGLQATLSKRNAVIADLTEKLRVANEGEPTQAVLLKAYRDGWRACAATFGAVAHEAEAALRTLSKIGRRAHIDGYDLAEKVERPARPAHIEEPTDA